MEVQIRDEMGALVWSRSGNGGLTSSAYAFDTTLEQIKHALALALQECEGELAVADNVDRVADVTAAAT